MPQHPPKTFAEFFAGIGLVRAGLEPLGWRCVYANDIDPNKQLGYEAQHGKNRHFHRCDIANTAEVLGQMGDTPFLATASFPCVDLSLAGHYRGFAGGAHSSTLFAFGRVIAALGAGKPSMVLLENVPGFLTSNRGQDFAAAATLLASLGYWLDVLIVDARHFTPQSRPRVFVIGVVPELVPPDEARHGRLWSEVTATRDGPHIARFKRTLELATGWMTLSIPDPPNRAARLDDVIDTGDDQPWWAGAEVQRHSAMMSEAHRERIGELLASGQPWVGTAFRRVRHNVVRAEVRFDGLAGCLRTPRGGSARQIVVAVARGELRMRWMTPREYARLQGAPDVPLVGTPTQQLWGFADAVCVPAISWLDRHVLTPIHERSFLMKTARAAS